MNVSGGEAKRLTVASVLLDNPSILFLDEPTTGLDSHMAQSLMNTLQKLAKDGRTIVCTIHQPSSNIFNALDKVGFWKFSGARNLIKTQMLLEQLGLRINYLPIAPFEFNLLVFYFRLYSWVMVV